MAAWPGRAPGKLRELPAGYSGHVLFCGKLSLEKHG